MQRIDAYAQQRVQQGMRRGATHHRHIPTQRSSSFHIVPVAPHLVTYVPLLLPLSKPLDTHMSVLSDRLFPSDDLTPGSSLPPSLPRSNSCSSSLQGKRRNSSRQLELRISSLMRLGGLASFCRWEISTRLRCRCRCRCHKFAPGPLAPRAGPGCVPARPARRRGARPPPASPRKAAPGRPGRPPTGAGDGARMRAVSQLVSQRHASATG